jgi:hypothetical protein
MLQPNETVHSAKHSNAANTGAPDSGNEKQSARNVTRHDDPVLLKSGTLDLRHPASRLKTYVLCLKCKALILLFGSLAKMAKGEKFRRIRKNFLFKKFGQGYIRNVRINVRGFDAGKITGRYATDYLTMEGLGYAILNYVRKRHPNTLDEIEIITFDGRRFIWNWYYEHMYNEGKITAQQLFDYVFKYKVVVQYSLRFGDWGIPGHEARYRGQTYYKGVDYVFTAVAPECFDLNDNAEIYDLAINDSFKRFGITKDNNFLRIDYDPNFDRQYLPEPEIISAQLVDVTTGKTIQYNNSRRAAV